MTPFLYVSHPQVQVDPQVPVPQWGLSDLGRARAMAFARRPLVRGYGRIVSSDEVKAQETAAILAQALGLPVEVHPDLHENDRSATGFLPEAEFQAVATEFFAHPTLSIRGWETAADAQARIIAAVRSALDLAPQTPTVFVGHGGVGTLLLCALAGYPVSRVHDQPPVGGGCWYAQSLEQAPDRWRAMEEDPAP
ncbi:MAG: histidine phosphatase family protein [Rhizobiales bacterium 32-66-8]|nr:MAG: histidine phosphatase family protein [Rhizobiales bacterium 32-66-8]